MESQLPKDIRDLLESVVKENLGNFELKIHDGNKLGSGLMGEMTFVTLKNKKTDVKHDFVVKQVLPSNSESTLEFMSSIFFNETQFYTKIWPAYQNFHNSYPEAKLLDSIPKCYGFTDEKGKEKLVLENLKIQGFQMHPKSEPVSFEAYQEIFKIFGKFHGLSLAFKNYNPIKFSELGKPLPNNWVKFKEAGVIGGEIKGTFSILEKILKSEGENQIAKKLEKYFNNSVKLYSDGSQYNGPYSVIIHGDCWSNNMMFKYNAKGKIEALKFLDYQMTYIGSPIFDLQYSLYSGATKETLDKLDQLMKTYYNVLSQTLNQYSCNPESIYPFLEFKREWKDLIDFGFIMGILMWGAKTDDSFGQQKLNEALDNDKAGVVKEKDNVTININIEKYTPRALDLVRHMYENDFL